MNDESAYLSWGEQPSSVMLHDQRRQPLALLLVRKQRKPPVKLTYLARSLSGRQRQRSEFEVLYREFQAMIDCKSTTSLTRAL